MRNIGRFEQRVSQLEAIGGALALAIVLLLGSSPMFGQRTTGTLKGQVTDQTGAVIGNAKVTALDQATGVSDTTTTTSAGTFVFPSLIPGKYALSIEAPSFRKYVRKDVEVRANQDNESSASLTLGEASQVVEVIAGEETVQTTTTTLSNSFSSREVLDLPNAGGALNGSPLNLAILVPNAVAQPGGTAGEGGSIGGTRPRFNSFTIDGVDDNNKGVTGPLSTVIPDAVGQFQLVTNQFGAEYSHSAGGIFALTTKTGTNAWHGSGEWYGQNRNWNAPDNLTKQAIASGTLPGIPAYDDNRAGGTIGGPIIKNKWFIFGAYEFTYLHGQGNATSVTAPTAPGLATLMTLAADPMVRNRLSSWPTAPANDAGSVTVNGSTIPLGNDIIISPLLQREHDVQVNSDYTLGRHQLGARFLLNQITFIAPVQTPQAVFNQMEPVHSRKIALTDTWSISDHWLNDLRFSYSYWLLATTNPATATGVNDITISQLGFFQTGPTDEQTNKQNTYQVLDNVSYSHGKHTLKFGGEYRHYIAPANFLPRGVGDYWYTTLAQFVNDQVPGVTSRTLRGAGSGFYNGRQSGVFAFIQDDYKVSPRVTLNLGLRYEYYTNTVGENSQVLNAISSVPGVITFGKPKTDKNNFGPRFGVAWDPTGSGKWAIRAGAGIAYDVKFDNFASISLPAQQASEINETIACALPAPPAWCAPMTGFLANGGLPAVFQPPTTQAQARALTTSFVDNTVLPKIITWTLSVQHEVYRGASFEVRYLGTRGLSLPVQDRLNRQSAFDQGAVPLPTYFNPAQVPATVNLAIAPTDAAFNAFNSNTLAAFGFLGNITADPPKGSSTYHAGSASFTQRSRWGLTLNVNYTYSHTLDNATNEFFTSLLNPRRAQDTNHLNQDWGNSDLDVRHKFVLTWLYELPKAQVSSGFLKALLNGYQVNGTFVAQTGQPFTIQSGLDSNGNGDSAGDRVVLNPTGSPLLGSDIFPVCAMATGVTYVPTANGGIVSGNGACNGTDPAVGYLAVNPNARFVVAGPGALATAGRNSVFTPGFGTWNFSIFKNTHITESRYFQFRAEFYNVFNHRSFALSNGNVFSTAGIAAATGNPGYAQASDPTNFLNSKVFSGGSRLMTLGLKFVF
jgi:outer membrane receptor protein involved in Fe transport